MKEALRVIEDNLKEAKDNLRCREEIFNFNKKEAERIKIRIKSYEEAIKKLRSR